MTFSQECIDDNQSSRLWLRLLICGGAHGLAETQEYLKTCPPRDPLSIAISHQLKQDYVNQQGALGSRFKSVGIL